MDPKIPTGPLLIEQTRKIPAGENSRLGIPGQFFRIKEATYGFSISLNDSPAIPFDLGMQYKCPPGEFFETLTLVNTLAVEIEVTVLIGRGEISDDRLNIVERRNGSASSNIPDVWQNAVPGGFASITVPGAWVKIAEANPNRAELFLREIDAQGFLLSYDSAGTQQLIYAAYAQFSLKFKGEVWAKRSGGTSANLFVTEWVFG